MIGHTAEALEHFDSHGAVLLDGERWNAEIAAGPVIKGERLTVARIDGLVVQV